MFCLLITEMQSADHFMFSNKIRNFEAQMFIDIQIYRLVFKMYKHLNNYLNNIRNFKAQMLPLR